MAKKYNPLEPQVNKRTYIIIGTIFILLIALIFILSPSNKTKVYNEYKLYASEDFTEDHPFYEVKYKNGLFKKGLKSILKTDEVALVFISHPSCETCIKYIGAFEKYYYQLEVEKSINKIYYFNALNKEKDLQNFELNFEGVREEVPQMLLFVNGKVEMRFTFSNEVGTQIINRSVRDFYQDVLDIIK